MHRGVPILLAASLLAMSTSSASTTSAHSTRTGTSVIASKKGTRVLTGSNLPSNARRKTAAPTPRVPLGGLPALHSTISAWNGGDDGPVGDVDQPVSWTNVVGASASDNTLTKTGTNTAWNAGAASANLIRDAFGYVEFTKTETSGRILAGLSNGDSGVGYEDVDYGFHTDALGNAYIFEAGTNRGQVGTYVAGDRFRVEVRYGVVRYFRNGQLLYTSAVPAKYPLRVDAALYDPGVSVTDVRVGSSTWTREIAVAVSGSSLRKTGAAGWTSGAVSANTLEAGDGAMEFTATETNTTRTAGLSDADVNQSWQDIAYGIELHDDATVEVVEAGTSRGAFGWYAAGDRFRVEVVSGVVTYARNGSVFYTSALAPSYPIVVDTALYSVAATLTDVVLVPLVWTNLSGVSVSENSLTKSAADGWNAGASTTFGLLSDNGYLEFKAVETNTRRTVGFKSGTGTAQTYADLAYAIDLGATGIVTLFEDGISQGTFGSYAHGDRFRIEIAEGVVRYFRNGSVLYTSTATPTYPLHGDVRLYTAGATVADVLGGTEVWMPPVNVTAMGSSLVKTGSGVVAWDAEALSSRGFGTGFIEFTASQTNVWRHVGLTNGDNGTDYSDLDFAIHLNQLAQVHVFQGATYIGSFGNYAAGDRFRVEVANGIVRYLRNGAVFYTSTLIPTLPLRPDVNIDNPSASLLNIRTGGVFMVETPTLSPGSGTYSSVQTVTISTTTADATIRYTVDGSTPTEASPVYTAAIPVTTSTTIKAAAFRTGWTPSGTASAAYTMNFGTLPLPGIVPAAGTYTSEAAVTLSSIAGATIRYTLNGADPTTTSTLYMGPFSVVATATLKVKAWHPDYTASAVASAAYAIVVAAPTLTPAGGSYPAGQLITVATATAGATITYTLNGVDPVQTDPVVPPTGTLTAGNYTLKTKAWKTGATASAVTSAAYAVTGDLVPPTVAGAVFAGFGLRGDGTVWGWGRNDYSSVGDGTSTPRFNPVSIGGLTGVRAIGAGYYRNLALLSNGSVAGWGLNTSAEIGDGTLTNRATPTPVVGLSDALALASGTSHAIAIRANGTVVTWGYNGAGQLGDGTTTNRTAPVAVAGLTSVTAVAAGTDQTLALKNDGTVWSWGDNAQGQLGDGTTTRRLTPVQVSGLTNVVFIHAGNGSSLAIKADGTVWTWGWNFYGQLGDGTRTNRLTPAQMSGVTNAVAGGVGWEYSLVLRGDGSVWTTGRNSEGQLGTAGGDRSVLAQVTGLPSIARIGVGAVTAFAVTSDGAAWGWGRNVYENIGDGTNIGRGFPVPIAGPGLVWRPWIPAISLGSGQFSTEQNPVVSNADPSAVMHYSLTGVDPTEADPSVAAGSAIVITQSATLKVRSFKSGAPPSEVAAATYTLKVPTPTFSPTGGSYASPQTVTLSMAISSAVIRVTTDGSAPSTFSPTYSGPISVTASAAVKTFATRSGWTSSDIASVTYWIAPSSTLTAPTIAPATGTYTGGRVVSIASVDAGVTIRYSIDGSDPSAQSQVYVRPFGIDQTLTVKAKAFKATYNPSSTTTTTLTIAGSGQSAAPSLSPGGGRFTTQRTVTVTGPAGAVLRYTTNGSDPTDTSTSIASGGSITVDRTLVLKVRAWESGLAVSTVRREDYVITGAVSAGEMYSVALKADGSVWTWGQNVYGQLGDSATVMRTAPVQILTGATAIAAGFRHGLALKSDGTVWAWGENYSGEVGDGTTITRRTAVQVPGLTNVVAIAGGFVSSYALKGDGTVWGWGANWAGQLGDGTTTARWSPTQVPGLAGVQSIAAGEGFALAVVSNGAASGGVWAWGANGAGQLGDGTTTTRLIPQPIARAAAVKDVYAGRAWAAAKTRDDELLIWGVDDNGQQANGFQNGNGVVFNNLVPVRTAPWIPLKQIGAAYYHVLALAKDGQLWGWGDNWEFELAFSPGQNFRLTAELIPAFTQAAAVTGGAFHSLAIDRTGQVWTWGRNSEGQLGTGNQTWAASPVLVSSLTVADNSFMVGDADGDGVPTWREYELGLDPLSPDTDGDGIADAVDLLGGDNATNLDPDGDGLSTVVEDLLGTDAYSADTDGDGAADGVDAYPLDPARSQAPATDPNDHTPPVITLIYPTNARPVGGGF